MDSSAALALSVPVQYSALDSLRLGRTTQTVVVRLIRFWDSKRIRKDGEGEGEFLGITLLLLDEKDLVIHGFIPANLSNRYRSFLNAGTVVRLDRFEIARCSHTYKITEHQYLLRFIPSTRIVEIQSEAPVIGLEHFMIRRYDHLQILANTSLELPDVVGEIRSVQGSDLGNHAATTRVVVRLLIEPNVTVYLSLWDDAASEFRRLLKAGDKIDSVVLVTTVNPKIFGGSMYLNSTQGTRFFFDKDIPEIAAFIDSVGATESKAITCIDTLKGIERKELVTISDLNSYISGANEQTQEADFLCKARVVGIISENGWSFISCTACNKKLEKRETSLYCSRCLTADVTGVIRYRVELAVDDGVDSATFVVFDKEMTKLTKQEAADLAGGESPNSGDEEVSGCIEGLTGHEFVFQIRVTPFNFTPNHRTFTVSTMTKDETAATEQQREDGNQLPSNVREEEVQGTSKCPSTRGGKSAEDLAGPATPAKKKRRLG